MNVGILGTGGIAAMHAEGMLRRRDIFHLLSACDTSASSLGQFAAHYGVSKTNADYRAILEDREIDAVIVLLPHGLHEAVCREAFAAGKHVLLEKPIARTAAEAEGIIGVARASGRTLMVAHNERYFWTHRKIKQMLGEGAFGRIVSARADHYQNFDRAPGSWWRSRAAVGGGCVIGSGIHRLDLLRWFLGEVEEVFAYEASDEDRLEAEVACTAVLKFKSGAIGEFFINWGVYRSPVYESLAVFGKSGSLYLNDNEPFLEVNHAENPGNRLSYVYQDRAYESMWEHFYTCVVEGAEPMTSGTEAIKALQIALAVNQSAETGRPVKL